MDITQKLSIISLNELSVEEQNDNFIYSLREEIIENVMKEIDIIETKNKLLQFVSNCAYDALVQLLTFKFYHHSAVPNLSVGGWKPDMPVPPSLPDTWAANNVPIISKKETKKVNVVSQESVSESETVCSCLDSIVCECTIPLDQRVTRHLESLDDFIQAKELESEFSEDESTTSASSMVMITLSNTPSQTKDYETLTEESTEQFSEHIVEPKLENCALIVGIPKLPALSKATMLPKIDVAAVQSPPNLFKGTLTLPPVRVSANFEAREIEPEVTETKKKR